MSKENGQTDSRGRDEFVVGLKGLSEFLSVSHVTAAKIKKCVPFYQYGRTIRFKKDEILAALSNNNQTI